LLTLVTGGCGFIGSHLVDELLRRGYRVRILDSLVETVHENGRPPAYLSPDAELIRADIRDKDAVAKALRGVEVVFHLAAHQGYLPDYSTFFDVNSVGTALLFEVIAEERLDLRKVIVASSQAVYGEGHYRCREHGVFQAMPRPLARLRQGLWEHVCPVCGGPVENLLAEESRINPNTQYAMSKYTQELIALNLGRRHGIPVVNLRYSITLGSRQSFRNAYSGILRSFALRMRLKKRPIIFEDGLSLRDYIHIDDLIAAHMYVLDTPAADYRVFNVATGQATSVLNFFQELNQYMGGGFEPEMNGDFRVGDVRHIVSSPDALMALGWSPRKGIKEMIADYLTYLDQAGDLKDYFEGAMAVMQASAAIQRAQGGERP